MKTTTFINKIKSIFNPKSLISRNMNIETGKNVNSTMFSAMGSNYTTGAIPQIPAVGVEPATKAVSMAAIDKQYIKGKDLGSWAMDQCIANNGNTLGLVSSLKVVLSNYKLEAIAQEEELKGELVNAINIINDEIIDLNNKISTIQDFHIPEKENHIAYLEEQMKILENNTTYDLQTNLGNETYTILATSKAHTKEIIRSLHAKIMEMKTLIEQKEIKMKTLREQMENINLYNKEIVQRRLHIFFDGWLKGLEGIGASKEIFDENKDTFENFEKSSFGSNYKFLIN